MPIQDHNISMQDLDQFCKEVLSMNKEQLQARAEHWHKLMANSKEVRKFTNLTAMMERISSCNPQVAVENHLICMDFGFTLAETVIKRSQNQKQVA